MNFGFNSFANNSMTSKLKQRMRTTKGNREEEDYEDDEFMSKKEAASNITNSNAKGIRSI